MGWKSVACVGLMTPLAGCNLAYYAGHNLTNEPVSRVDEHKLQSRLQSEAKATWREVCHQYPSRTFTPEFADGFVDGFVDYLDHGGEPKPPAIPPLKYRRNKYLTPEGHARVRDYFCGFKYGAEVAAASGERQYLVVPVVLPDQKPREPLNIVRLPAPPDPDAPVVPPLAVPSPTAPPPQPLAQPAPPAAKPAVPAGPPAKGPAPEAQPPAATVPGVTVPTVPAKPEVKPDPQPLTSPVPDKPADPLPPASPRINALPPAAPPVGPGTGLPTIDLPFTDPTSILKPSGGVGGGVVVPAIGSLPAVDLPPPAEPPAPVPAVAAPPAPLPPAAPPPADRP